MNSKERKMREITDKPQRDRWQKLIETTITEIDAIDEETPAVSQFEPKWWVEMMEIRSKLWAIL